MVIKSTKFNSGEQKPVSIEDMLKWFSKKRGGRETLILDIGCGKGNKLKYFSRDNFKVISMDKSKGVIKTASKRIPKRENIKFIISDIGDAEFKKNIFDLIIVVAVLNYLPKLDALNILSKIKKWTKCDGYNIVSVFRGEDESLAQKSKDVYIFDDKELKKNYLNWTIKHYQEFPFIDKDHGEQHVHHVSEILAKKDSLF